jgi:magnesium chelatase family protein
MHVDVPRLSFEQMQDTKGESSCSVRERVIKTREAQLHRNNTLNSQLTHQQIDDFCVLRKTDQLLLKQVIEKLQLSARAWHRILKLARTIADMDVSSDIYTQHLTEAINYRRLDRSF